MRILLALMAANLLAQSKPDIRVDVELVTVACSATDRAGAPVRNLTAKDFTIRDNGRERAISQFWQESDLPLTVGLVVDASGSQSGFIARHRDTIAQFLTQVIGARDRAFLVQVNQQARLVTDLTGSLDRLRAGVDEIGTKQASRAAILGEPCKGPWKLGCGGTALWHALYFATAKMKTVEGRKALIVLSDGMDTGSDRSVADVIEEAQGAGVVVYAIKYASPVRFLSPNGFSHGMQKIAVETGGLAFPDPKRKAAEMFAKIEAELRNMYMLGFAPADQARDGKFHKLTVASRTDIVVRARTGYWSASQD